ncbi:MAG: hypothetical protein ACRDRR_21955 [Pseudonocardiaceae bacterium]
MTVLTSAHQHPVDLSLMSDEDYVAYQRGLDDELTERYYARGLTPPGMTPLPSTLAQLEPPF